MSENLGASNFKRSQGEDFPFIPMADNTAMYLSNSSLVFMKLFLSRIKIKFEFFFTKLNVSIRTAEWIRHLTFMHRVPGSSPDENNKIFASKKIFGNFFLNTNASN